MANTYFRFKQFTIHHDRCAMKVGTDGVLLGAWAPIAPPSVFSIDHPLRILDVGTGSGLIALMLAQRFPTATIEGIDIDAAAVVQARENIAASPFAARCIARHSTLHDLTQSEPYDAIVCNPPFFEESLLPPDSGRAAARHTTTLPFPELVADSARLLCPGGRFCVVLPTTAFDAFHRLCAAQSFSLTARCTVFTTSRKPPKRTLACFTLGDSTAGDFDSTLKGCTEETLTLMADGQRTEAYTALMRPFYL